MTPSANRNVTEATLFEMIGRLYVSWQLGLADITQLRREVTFAQNEQQRLRDQFTKMLNEAANAG